MKLQRGDLAAILLLAVGTAEAATTGSMTTITTVTTAPTTTASSTSTSSTSVSSAESSTSANNSGIPSIPPGPSPTAACGTISSLWAQQAATAVIVSGTLSPVPTVPASLAHDCLLSIPLHKDEAIELLDAVYPYLQFQSDLAYLKDPPKDYPYPAFDCVGQLEMVRENLVNDNYTNEIEWQLDFYQITAQAHDGHFTMYPDALTKAFDYGRPLGLVSIANHSEEQPVIKILQDIQSNANEAQTVTQINGMEASQYVQDIANSASMNQDPDAAYNMMFFSRVLELNGVPEGWFQSGGRHRFFYPGPNTTIAYANGTNFTVDNFAYVRVNMTNVTDGESYYQRFCAVKNATNTTTPSSVVESLRPVGASRFQDYPVPVLATNDSSVTAYYLDGTGYEDVAVIYLSSFEPRNPAVFQAAVAYFIQLCQKDNKSKVIIDIQSNGGGFIFQGYDTYRQFFPAIKEQGYSRWRENPGFVAISELVSARVAGLDPYTSDDKESISYWESWWNYRYDLNQSDNPFESYDAKFAPHTFMGDPYTAIMQWNLNDNLTTTNSTFGLGMEITGYGSLASVGSQPFPTANVVLLSDGFCASTCSLFSTFMKWNGGVKSIAVGGRPGNHTMQSVGGVKGAQILNLINIYKASQDMVKWNKTSPTADQSAALANLTNLPNLRLPEATFNVRDQILIPNLVDQTPAQFVQEPADCRLAVTYPMIDDVTNIWKAAASAAWGGAPCVAGSNFTVNNTKRQAPVEAKKKAKRAARTTVIITEQNVKPEFQKVDKESLKRYNLRVRV